MRSRCSALKSGLGAIPVAALPSGFLGTWIGGVGTMWIGAIGQLFAGVFVIIGPFWSRHDLPDAQTASPAADERTR